MNRPFTIKLAVAVTIAIIGLGILELVAQTPAPAPATPAAAPTAAPAAEKPASSDKTFWQVIKQGGIMMIPLGLTSVTMIALVIDSLLKLRNDKMAPPDLVEQLRSQFRTGDYHSAYQACKGRTGMLSNVIRVGLSMLGHGRVSVESAMEDALAKEVSTLGTRVRYLSVIGVVSPMLGLTGTVIGMIHAFSVIGQSGIGDPSALAAAIGEVLVATASGLFVAIPGFAFYYVFTNRIIAVTAFVEDVVAALFRGMPYDEFTGIEIGDEAVYAAPPSTAMLERRATTGAVVPASAESVLVAQRAPGTVPSSLAACPSCQQSVAVGEAVCPNCKTELSWGGTNALDNKQ